MKILYVTTISLTMNSFFKPHIDMLVKEGHKVDIACNYKDLVLDNLYSELGCDFFQIDFSRSPLSFNNVKAFFQLKKIIKDGGYDIVHCHTPNAAVITRLVCRKFRKNGLKVFYTAHGFHFYKGAPKFNWLFFYPVEKICSKFTDKLITINKEDYELAKSKFYAKEVHYIPGVGVDLSRFENVQVNKSDKRRETGVPEDAILLLSVGELNENKNHQVVIKALTQIDNKNIHYAIAGIGDKKEYLLNLAKELGLSDRVHLLGYRNDVAELYKAADIFCFPSIREGLGLAAVEAMACGLPVVAADNRGTRSFIEDETNGFICKYDDEKNFADVCVRIITDSNLKNKIAVEGIYTAKKFSQKKVLQIIQQIHNSLF
ncbi:MAG: glycosyltransferase family 4 protein [Oscillospiraceae bacterium]|nr:glycosyltransferase family 4 protein [Oscillospiraceae bacterium]